MCKSCRDCGATRLLYDAASISLYCQDCGLENATNTIDYQANVYTSGDPYGKWTETKNGTLNTELTNTSFYQLSLCKDFNSSIKSNFCALDNLCIKLGITIEKVRNCVHEVYTRMMKSGAYKSVRLVALQSACVLYAVRLQGGSSNRTLKEVVKASCLTRREIFRCFKKVKQELKNGSNTDMEFLEAYSDCFSSVIEHPVVSYAKNYAQNLHLPGEWIHTVAEVACKACPDTGQGDISNITSAEKVWDGRSRDSIAATIVYVITRLPRCPNRLDVKTVAKRLGVGEATIASCYRDMLPVMNRLLDVVPNHLATFEDIQHTFQADSALL